MITAIAYRVTRAMNTKYSAVLIALMLVAAEAHSISGKSAPAALVLPAAAPALVALPEAAPASLSLPAPVQFEILEERTWDGLGLQADVNDYVDNTIDLLVPFIQKYGLDPMPLPEVVEGFSVRPFLITYSAWLKIHNGYMTGLVNVARNGDQIVNYFAKMLRVRVQLQFTDLVINYRYLAQAMNLGPTGGIIASLSRFVVTVDLLIDFNNDEIHLQQFSLTDIGRLRVRFIGNILTDWLVNPLLNVFVSIFDNVIIKVVELSIRSAVQSALVVINTGIKDIIEQIESFNPTAAALKITQY